MNIYATIIYEDYKGNSFEETSDEVDGIGEYIENVDLNEIKKMKVLNLNKQEL